MLERRGPCPQSTLDPHPSPPRVRADPLRSQLQLRDLSKMLLASAEKEQDWRGQLRALREAEVLIRAAPDELEHYSGEAGRWVGVVARVRRGYG